MDSSDSAPLDPVARFQAPDVGAGGDWGALPFPSDLFLDSTGHLLLNTFPGTPDYDARGETLEAFKVGLQRLTGTGFWTNVYFPVGGDVDPETLTGNVHLVDLEDMSALPIDVVYRADLKLIVASMKLGTALKPGHSYGAYVTAGTTLVGGLPLSRDDDFDAIADLSVVPDAPALVAAQDSLRPLFAGLAESGADSVIVATVFKTTNALDVTQAMIAGVHAADTPTITDISVRLDLDRIFGVSNDASNVGWIYDPPFGPIANPQPHDSVAVLIHATINVQSYHGTDSSTAELPVLNEDGDPVPSGLIPVRVTFALPRAESYANTPVVVLLHGIGKDRSDMLPLANAYNAQGLAVLAFDFPFHGDRAKTPRDLLYKTTGETVTEGPADGFGDPSVIAALYFFQMIANEYPRLDPRIMMENPRRTAIDLVGVIRFVTDGSVSELNQALIQAELPSDLSFQERVVLHGESLGVFPSAAVTALEPAVGAAILNFVPAGLPFPSMFHSPYLLSQSPSVPDALLDVFAAGERTIPGDPVADQRWEPVATLCNYLFAEMDPVLFASSLITGAMRGDSGADILSFHAYGDEVIPNTGNEAFAKLANLERVPVGNMAFPNDTPLRYQTLTETSAPASGNVNGGARTGALVSFYPAGHVFTTWKNDFFVYEHDFPPFIKLETPVSYANPIVEGQKILSEFARTFFSDGLPVVIDPYAD